MSNPIPDDKLDLLERPIVCALATVMPNGQPQVTPVWFHYDGSHIWVNTARGRKKDQNMTARPQASVLVVDPENPYRYLEVRGKVDEITEDGALDHINYLSNRYLGREDYYAWNPKRKGKETRVIYKIRPVHAL